jgi:hypothetical protein
MNVSHGTEVCPSCLQTQLDNMCRRERDTALAVEAVLRLVDDLAVYELSKSTTDIAAYKRTFLPRIQTIHGLLSGDEEEEDE